MKGLGWTIIIGGFLMGIATLLHPIIINPWSVLKVVPKTTQPFWMWDHALMLLAIALWLLGLAGVKPQLKLNQTRSMLAVVLFTTSFTIWVLTLTMEIGVFPPLGRDVLSLSTQYIKILWSVLFSFGLLSGYVAMGLTYIGIIFLSYTLRRIEGLSVLSSWGFVSGWIGAVGILLTLIKIEWGLVLLIVTTLPPFLWTLILGFRLIKSPPTIKN